MMFLFIPLVWPVVALWAVGILLGGGTVAILANSLSSTKKNKIGILGMREAGKTHFLHHLMGKPYPKYIMTARDDYDNFTYITEDKKKIKFLAGKDMGGGDFYRGEYEDIIKDSTATLYFFDINKYFKDVPDEGVGYRRACNSRFEHVYSTAKQHKKPFVIIATHIDQCNYSLGEIKRKFDEKVSDKAYKKIFKNMHFVNLTNSKQIKELVVKIFVKKK